MRISGLIFLIYVVGVLGLPQADALSFTAMRLRTDTGDIAPGDGVCANVVGQCSLRAAVDEANALPGHDTIQLTGAPGDESAALVLDEIVIRDDLDIIGEGHRGTLVTGVRLRRLLRIEPGVSVRITDLSLEAGNATDGGIVHNGGSLQLERVHMRAGMAKQGGAIFNSGNLHMVDCLLHGNVGQAPNSLGGALYNAGSVQLDRVTIAKNQAVFGCGGGIYNAAGASLDVVNSTIAKNNGRKGRGGAVCNAGSVRMVNATIVRNRATLQGGGVFNDGGTAELVNTLLAQNTGGGRPSNCEGADLVSLGHNLDDGTSCGFSGPGDRIATKPGIRSLTAQYDGFTPVIVMKSVLSPAIDTADDAFCPVIDQRGWPRPAGAACDIGAVEYQPPPPTPTRSSTPTRTATLTPGPATPTRTGTLTRTPTPTRTHTVTLTPNPSASVTLTATVSPTPSTSPTPSITVPPSATLTATLSATVTITPTETPTPSLTMTATLSPSPTVTMTATETPTPSDTPTPTITPTPRPPAEFFVDLNAFDSGDASPGDGLCASAAGVCSLRAAVEEANASSSHDTIHLGLGTAKIRGELRIVFDVDLVGSDMYDTVIDGGKRGRVLRVLPGASVHVREITLAKGIAEEGGILLNEGILTMEGCRLRNGKAQRGAGLVNDGSATLTDVFFDGHTDAPPSGLGGCIHNRGTLLLDRVSLKRGQARLGCGGGIYNAATGVIDAVNLTVMRNRSRLARAGGICNEGGVVRCTNCTIARNQANNTAGGILNMGGTIELINTIVADNFHGGVGRGGNCAGDAVTSLGHNIESSDTCGFSMPGDRSNLNPRVRAMNFVRRSRLPVGAFENTHSPAIDTADPTQCPAVDALSNPRPSGAGCDIGSYEYQF